MRTFSLTRISALALTAAVLGGCVDEQLGGAKHLQPLSYATLRELDEKGMSKSDPIVVRIFKEDNELEIWKPGPSGRFEMFKTYEICKWSGKLGPKRKEGDKQAPEGFYTVTPAQMNPNSAYYLSFNLGYPNTFDRAHGRTGKHLMVHGACSSAGCYAMTDDTIAEVYSLARDAFRGGQRSFQVQAYPFRMTPENMARHAGDANMPFWRTLKEGSDHFEVTGLPPKVGVCDRKYVFNATPANPSQRMNATARCPVLDIPDNIEVAVEAKQIRDETAYQVALAEIRLREKNEAEAERIMVASLEEQGSADGYKTEAEATNILGRILGAGRGTAQAASQGETRPAEAGETTQVAQNDSARDDIEAPAETAVATQSSVPETATAFSGVWGKLATVTGLKALGNAIAGSGDEQDADPITTGTVPTSEAEADDKSASLGSGVGGQAPQSAMALLPIIENDDPFAIFDYFKTVNGVSVPVDMAVMDPGTKTRSETAPGRLDGR